MRTPRRPSHTIDESGFSLVELMASLTVLAIGIVSTASVIMSSLDVGSQGNIRARAVAVATRDADSMRAVPYDRLGFAATQPSFVPTFEGGSTVQVGDPVLTPDGPAQLSGGTSFGVRRHITWADASSATTTGLTFAEAYKRISVIVTWTDRSGAHEARQDGIVYPGGRGPYTGPQGSVTTTTVPAAGSPAAPVAVTATVPAGTPGTDTVSLSWTPPTLSSPAVATWVVQYSTNGFVDPNIFEVTDNQPAATPSFNVTGLSASTTYRFRVAGRSSAGATSTWAVSNEVTTSAASGDSCQLGTATITPSAIKRRSASSTFLRNDATVSINTNNIGAACAGLRLVYKTTATGAATTVWLAQTSGGLWTGTVDGDQTSWDTGTHEITVRDNASDNLGKLTLTVCVHNAGTCP